MAVDKTPAGGASRLDFELGQKVLDRDGKKVGKVRARFSQYILVERGGLFGKAYYVPKSVVTGNVKGVIRLALSEDDLSQQGMDSLPDDLYHEAPEIGRPNVTGVPQIGRMPLSPAETGHYNYGRHWPGMNTDASGSYRREEILPKPQTVVEDAPDETGPIR